MLGLGQILHSTEHILAHSQDAKGTVEQTDGNDGVNEAEIGLSTEKAVGDGLLDIEKETGGEEDRD